MSTRRSARGLSFQHLYGSQTRVSRVLPTSKGSSPHRSAAVRDERQSCKPSASYGSMSNHRLLDVVPLFSINGTARHVEAVGDRVAWTAEADGCIRVRSLPKGGEVRTLQGREGCFCTCIFHVECCKSMWAAFSDGFIRVFDLNTYALLSEFTKHDKAVECMWEVEGYVFTGGRDWQIYQWKPDSYTCERRLSGHNNTIRCMCTYTGDTGAVLFSGSDDGTVRAWDPYLPAQKGKESSAVMHVFSGHTQGVLSLELVNGCNQLWSGGEDNTIRVFDLRTLGCVGVLKQHKAPVASLKLVGIRLWSGDKHGRILLWDPKTLTPLKDLSSHMQTNPGSVLCISKVKQLVSWKVWTPCSGGRIYCWNADVAPIIFDGPTGDKDMVDVSDTIHLLTENKALRSEVEKLRKRLVVEDDENVALVQRGSTAMSPSRAKSVPYQRHRDPKVKRGTSSLGSTVGKRKSPTAASIDYSNDTPIREMSGTVPNEDDDAQFFLTSHEKHFHGDAWEFVFRHDAEELCAIIRDEVAHALSIPARQVRVTKVELTGGCGGCVAMMDIDHDAGLTPSEIDVLLGESPFTRVYELYERYLTKRYVDPNETLATENLSDTPPRHVHQALCVSDSRKVEGVSNSFDDCGQMQSMVDMLLKENEQLRGQLATKAEVALGENDAAVQVAVANYEHLEVEPRITQLEDTVAQREDTIRVKEDLIQKLERQVEAMAKDGNMKGIVRDLRDAKKRLVAEAQEFRSRIEQLEQDKRRVEDEARACRKENELLLRRVSETNVPTDRTSTAAENEQLILTSYEKENVKPRIAQLERSIAERDEALRIKEEHMKELARELEAIRGEGGAKSRDEASDEAGKAAVGEVQVLQTQIKALKKEKHKLSSETRAYKKENELLRGELADVRGKLEGIPSCLADEKETILMRYEEESVKPRMAKLEEVILQKEEAIGAKDEKIKNLEEETSTINREVVTMLRQATGNFGKAITNTKESLLMNLGVLRDRLEVSEEDRRKLQEAVGIYKKENELLLRRVSETNVPTDRTSTAAENAQLILTSYEKENVKPRIAQLERSIAERDEALRIKEEHMKELARELEAIRGEGGAKSRDEASDEAGKAAVGEVQVLQTQIKALKKEKHKLSSETRAYKKENELLRGELADVRGKLEGIPSCLADEKETILMRYEEESVKPRMAKLEEVILQKEEAIGAKDTKVKQVEKQLRVAQRETRAAAEGSKRSSSRQGSDAAPAHQEELKALKSKLAVMEGDRKRLHGEVISLRKENEELRESLEDVSRRVRNPSSFIAREKQKLLLSYEEEHVKPRITRLEHAVALKDEHLRVKEERIHQLEGTLKTIRGNHGHNGEESVTEDGKFFRQMEEALMTEIQGVNNQMKLMAKCNRKMQEEAASFRKENQILRERLTEVSAQLRKISSVEAGENDAMLKGCEDCSTASGVAQLKKVVSGQDEALYARDERIRQLGSELGAAQRENPSGSADVGSRIVIEELLAENCELRNLVKHLEVGKQRLESEVTHLKVGKGSPISRAVGAECTEGRVSSLPHTNLHGISGNREALMTRLGTAIEQVHHVQREREAAERKVAVLQEDCRSLRMRLQRIPDTPIRVKKLFGSSTNYGDSPQTDLRSTRDAHLVEGARSESHSCDTVVESLPGRLTALEGTVSSLNTGLHDAIQRLSCVSEDSASLRAQIVDMLSERTPCGLLTDRIEES